jgi:hypothetical protein
MTRFVAHRVAVFSACACLLGVAGARADSAGSPPDPQKPVQAAQAPLLLEQSTDGLVFAPEVGATRVDGTTRTLAGGYAGWLVDNTFLLGAGVYWASGHDQPAPNYYPDRGMSYGGFVAGWMVGNKAVRFGVQGLFGFGNGTLFDNVTSTVRSCGWGLPCPTQTTTTTVTGTVRRDEGFFVAEPRAQVAVRLNRWMALTAEASYRGIAAGDSDADRRLRGVGGTLGVRFGPFR